MKKFLERLEIDWHLFLPALVISLAGLVTMNSFSGDNYFFFRQSIWLLVSVLVFFIATLVDWRSLRRTKALVSIFTATLLVLIILLLIGKVTRGAQSWFQ